MAKADARPRVYGLAPLAHASCSVWEGRGVTPPAHSSYVLSLEEKVPSRVFQAGSTRSSMLQRSADAMSDS